MHTFIGCLVLLLSLLSFKATAYCAQDWACVEVDRGVEGAEVSVRNNKAFPFTITVYAYTSNLAWKGEVRKQYERTLVVPGHQKIPVFELTKQRPDRRYRVRYDFQWTPGNMHAQHDDNFRYQLPYPEGSYYRIVQGFGGGYSHRGASRYAVDFAMPEGTPIHAARGGVVIDLTKHHSRGGPSRRYAKYANFVTILHDDDTTGEYYHLKRNGVVVEVGDTVEQGQLIGFSGNTGFSALPHLHFAIYRAKSHGNYESLPFRFSKRK